MHAVSINQIADILHFNDKYMYRKVRALPRQHWLYECRVTRTNCFSRSLGQTLGTVLRPILCTTNI